MHWYDSKHETTTPSIMVLLTTTPKLEKDMRFSSLAAIALSSILLLTACGQKGPLYIPETEEEIAARQAAAAAIANGTTGTTETQTIAEEAAEEAADTTEKAKQADTAPAE